MEGGLYHVYNRFARGAEVFREGDEVEHFREKLRLVRDRDGWTIFAWCLMSNHYHVVLCTGPVPLARSMGHLQSRFGAEHNRRWRSSGPLWQSRYKAKLVETEESLRRVIAYVHLNPVTAGLVEDPADYTDSGHCELLRRTATPLVDVETVLAIYGSSVRSARRAYVRSLDEVRAAEWRTELPGRLPWWGKEPDRRLNPPPSPVKVDSAGRTYAPVREELDVASFARRACELLGHDLSELSAPGKSREQSRLRYLVVTLAIERWRLTASELARVVGRRPDVVCRWAQRGVELRREDDGFRADFERLDSELVGLTHEDVVES